ncbi:hypothetical protein [Nostoc sp.]
MTSSMREDINAFEMVSHQGKNCQAISQLISASGGFKTLLGEK